LERLNNKGFASVLLILIVAFVFLLLIEIMQIYRLHKEVTSELTTLADMAIISSIAKISREGSPQIDLEIINQNIIDIKERVIKKQKYEKINVEFDEFIYQVSSTDLEISSEMTISLVFLKRFSEAIKLKLPIRARSQIQYMG